VDQASGSTKLTALIPLRCAPHIHVFYPGPLKALLTQNQPTLS